MGFFCLKFMPFKIMTLEALFFNDATKWRQRQRESATCPDFIGCAEPDLTLLALQSNEQKFHGYKSMAAVNVLALVVTLFGQ